MTEKIKIILSIIFSFLLVAGTGAALAANSLWTQTDWSGGADQSRSARHPDDQTSWNQYFSNDAITNIPINTSVSGEISLSLQPDSKKQASDVGDFDTGRLTNLRLVGTGGITSAWYEDNSSSVTKTGYWRFGTSTLASGNYSDNYSFSDETGAAATLTFTGSEVSWIGQKGRAYGIASVFLDGAWRQDVDLYNSNIIQFQQLLFSISGLTNTTHTLRIEVTGRRNPSASGPRVGVDAFAVVAVFQDDGAYLTLTDDIKSWIQTGDLGDFDAGTMTNLRLFGTGTSIPARHEDNSSSVTKTGYWRFGTSTLASGNYSDNYSFSDETGAAATFTFTGIEVSWIGQKGRAYGIASVFLDGAWRQDVDLYNSNIIQFQQLLFSISGLTNTTHTLRIEVTGRRNPSASGQRVGVDAFDIVTLFPDKGAYLRLEDDIPDILNGFYESPTFDTGDFGAIFSTIAWNAPVPPGSELKFQIASSPNRDNQIWDFVGPLGTINSYYVSSATMPNEYNEYDVFSGHNGDRYIRYRAFFARPVAAPEASPILNDVTISYGTTSGVYESPSFDTGLGGAFYTTLSWTAAEPPGSDVRFRIATNNGNNSWNFIGPDGTPDSYYLDPGSAISSAHDRNRYLKYQARLVRPSLDPTENPELHDVTVSYESYPPVQWLTSSPFDTTDETNGINRLKWSETLPSDTDSVIQLRTSPDGNFWAPWYGPHASTFSSSIGVSQVTVTDVTGFYVGGRVTLTNFVNPDQMEVKVITAINTSTQAISLNSATAYAYSANSILTDTYTDQAGMEFINPEQRYGNDDQWIQYRIFLTTVNGTLTPVFLWNQIGYLSTNDVFQPDGIIDGNGEGAGGASSKDIDPGYKTLESTYDILIQNDFLGNPGNGDDSYTITWNTPSDALGAWRVYLYDTDLNQDLTSPQLAVPFNFGEVKPYILKVRPTLYSPGGTSRDITINIRSENDLTKTDSITATAIVRSIFEADGIIDNIPIPVGGGPTNGDNIRDTSRAGGGGTVIKEGNPGDISTFSLRLQNEGNVTDSYMLSLVNPPPNGWTVLINDGTRDYDITNQSNFPTADIPAQPSSGYQVSYTVKVIPRGAPLTANIILNIFSNRSQTNRDKDSVKIEYTLKRGYKVDGIIYNFGYNGSGQMAGSGVQGSGCGLSTSGDNVYDVPPGIPGNGGGGCTALDITETDISGGKAREISVGVQNEGNFEDEYRLSWIIRPDPAGWTIVMQERLSNGTLAEYSTSPVDIPTATSGNPAMYNPGEMPFFTFRVLPPSGFISGSTITFDIQSLGDLSKTDSVKAVINSSDTTPPAAVDLSVGTVTATSVSLSWLSPGDDGNSGTATSYDLRYSTSPITEDNFTSASRVRSCKAGGSDLARPKPAGGAEVCVVQQLYADTNYYFALKTSDEVGKQSPISECPSCPARTLPSDDTTRPGQITDLAVVSATKDTLTLCWTAPADNGTDLSSGLATEYDVRYSTRLIVDGTTQGVGEVTFDNALVAQVVDGIAPPKAAGAKECYLMTVTNDINTGDGFIDNRIWNTRFYFAVKTFDERPNTSPLSNIAGGLTVLKPYAYNMVSVPYVPDSLRSSPQAVFGDVTGAQLNVYWWDSRGNDPDSGCYEGVPDPYSKYPDIYTCLRLMNISEGNGYFLWAPPLNVTLNVPPGATQSMADDCADIPGECFYVLPLQPGWNMIATPFDTEINFTDTRDISGNLERGIYLRGKTGGSTAIVTSFQQAVVDGLINGSIYSYNGSNYTFEICDGPDGGPGEPPLGSQCPLVMQPWKAYWVQVPDSALYDAFELLIPN